MYVHTHVGTYVHGRIDPNNNVYMYVRTWQRDAINNVYTWYRNNV